MICKMFFDTKFKFENMLKREKLKIFVISVISFRKVNCDALYRILRHDNFFPTCFTDAFFFKQERGGAEEIKLFLSFYLNFLVTSPV